MARELQAFSTDLMQQFFAIKKKRKEEKKKIILSEVEEVGIQGVGKDLGEGEVEREGKNPSGSHQCLIVEVQL